MKTYGPADFPLFAPMDSNTASFNQKTASGLLDNALYPLYITITF